MQSDTIIGIVGAVVLVAVMVGVFAYEYNNTPEPADPGPDPDSEEGRRAAFDETYPGLAAEGDIDNDGTPNFNDTDMDGDGTDNPEDDTICYCVDADGTVAARSGPNDNPSETFEFVIDEGMVSAIAEFSWEPTTVAGQTVDNLQVSVDGDVSCDSGTGEATCDMTSLAPGTYTITVQHAGAPAGAQPKAFTGSIAIQY